MKDIKAVLGYVLAGVILYLIIEEIKKYRKKKERKELANFNNMPIDSSSGTEDSQPNGNDTSRFVIY